MIRNVENFLSVEWSCRKKSSQELMISFDVIISFMVYLQMAFCDLENTSLGARNQA